MPDTSGMARTILIPTRFTGPWGRAAAILLVGGVVATASTFIGPASSNATPVTLGEWDPLPTESELAAAKAAKWPAYLGSLTGPRHIVEVYVGRNGPLYTVKTLEGETLVTQVNSDEVYARFPDLKLSEMHAEAATPPDTEGER